MGGRVVTLGDPESTPDDGPRDFTSGSYLHDGQVSLDAVEKLFDAARVLSAWAPWKLATIRHVLRADIAALEVEGAAISILGNEGDTLGFLILPSRVAFGTMLDHILDGAADRDMAFGTPVLSLRLARLEELPPPARNEIRKYGWKDVNGLYPWVKFREPGGSLLPLDAKKMDVVNAVAGTLGTFCMQAERAFKTNGKKSASITVETPEMPDVRYTMPYEAYDEFTPERDHLLPPIPAAAAPNGVEILEFLFQLARHHFGAAFDRVQRDFQDPAAAEQLLMEWSVFHFRIKGVTPAEFFLADGPGLMPASMREFIEAQQRGWLSIWEVATVDRGRGFVARDLLTGVERRVEDRKASESLVARHVLLGRIVDWEGRPQLWGVHSTPLPPHAAFAVVDAMRRRLKIGNAGLAPVELLQSDRNGRYLIAQWEAAIEQLAAERRNPPRMTTRDGEEVILCSVVFAFDAANRERIAAALGGMEHTVPPDAEERRGRQWEYTLLDPVRRAGDDMEGGQPMLGRLRLAGGELTLETNSRERCAAIEKRVAAVAGSWLRETGRTETDPREEYLAGLARKEPGEKSLPPLSTVPPVEVQEQLRVYKREYYRKWLDESIPALGGKTPRQAVRTASGRQQLDRLLRDMEHHEAQSPEWDRFDFSVVRRELGL